MRVLVVDDDPDIREVVSEILSAEGFCIATASNGRQALNALARAKAGAIVLDLMMPVTSGWEFLEQKSRSGRYAEAPSRVRLRQPPPARSAR